MILNVKNNRWKELKDALFVVFVPHGLLTNIFYFFVRHFVKISKTFSMFVFTVISLSVFAEAQAQYELPTLEITPLGSSSTLRIGDTVELAKFRISNRGNKHVLLESVTFKNRGRADLEEALVSPYISVNSETVTNQVSIDRKDVRFLFSYDGYLLERGNSVIMRVMSTISYARTGDTIELEIDRQEDLRALDASSGFYVPNNAEGVEFKPQTLRSGSIYTSGYSNRNYRYYGSRRNTSSTSPYQRILQPNYGNYTAPYNRYSSPRYSHSRYNNRSTTYTSPSNSYRTSSRLRTTEQSTYSPGSRDVVFLNRSVSSNRDFSVDGLFFPIDSSSFSFDKNGNGQNSDVDDFNDAFGEFVLYVDNIREGYSSSLEEFNGQIGVLFYNDLYFNGGYKNIKVTGRVQRSGENGDRLRLRLSNQNFINIEYQ